MSAIEAVSRNVKTLADGTLRLSVDISPVYAKEAFTMFGMPDVPLALARLSIQASQAIAQQEIIDREPKEPLTGLALLAVQWCQEPNFWKWLNTQLHFKEVKSEIDAKKIVLSWCEIGSRKELNTNTNAAALFQQEIRAPYMQWLRDEGVVL
jgi:hypothetical protein